MANAFKFGAKLPEIEYFAIVDDDISPIGRGHRLVTCFRQIDDCQAPVTETDCPFDEVTITIGATVCNGVGHATERNRRRRCPLQIKKASYATHLVSRDSVRYRTSNGVRTAPLDEAPQSILQ